MIYEVKNLGYTYPGMKKKTLSHCNLTLEEGEILTILGPNGAGKSTLLNCMSGLLTPQEGEVRLCGKNVRAMAPKEIARQIGYVQQNHNPVFGYSVLHFVTMGCAPGIGMFQKPGKKEEDAAMAVLESLEIGHLAEKAYTDISGGERQQVLIARAVVQKPKAILFDEPTSHLDYGKQFVILQLIRQMAEQGYAAVMTTHNPDHAILLGGSVAIVDKEGTVEKGLASKILTEERLSRIYRTDLRLRYVKEFQRIVCIAPGLQTKEGPWCVAGEDLIRRRELWKRDGKNKTKSNISNRSGNIGARAMFSTQKKSGMSGPMNGSMS
jgi:iron complex transport system ATP-binding protein